MPNRLPLVAGTRCKHPTVFGINRAKVAQPCRLDTAQRIAPDGTISAVVFATRKENRIALLALDIPQPTCARGILRRVNAVRPPPAVVRFADHVTAAIEVIKQVVKRHENFVVQSR